MAFCEFIRSLRFFFFKKFLCFIIYGQRAGRAANSRAQTLLAQVFNLCQEGLKVGKEAA